MINFFKDIIFIIYLHSRNIKVLAYQSIISLVGRLNKVKLKITPALIGVYVNFKIAIDHLFKFQKRRWEAALTKHKSAGLTNSISAAKYCKLLQQPNNR